MSVHLTDPGLQWFEDLADDNTRDFWTARKADYQTHVRQPFERLLAEIDASLPPPHGQWRIYRPHEDTRFRPGGPPLKTFIGAVAPTSGGAGLSVLLDQKGLTAALGMPYLAHDQLRAWRAALADDVRGDQVVQIIAEARAAGLIVDGGRREPLRGAPRGFAVSHPRIDLLRFRGIEARSLLGREAWSDIEGRAEAVSDIWRLASPALTWLEREVGPSSLPQPTR